MLKKRVIPVLLISDGGVVKTKKFGAAKYIGDPINAVKIFSEKEVDEIIVLDINASSRKLEPNYDFINAIASEAFMPFAYGGGISNLFQAEKILKNGAEKIILNDILFKDPRKAEDMINNFGKQSVVACLDIKKNYFNQYKLYSHINSNVHTISLNQMLKTVKDIGFGEIIIQSVDRDGTMRGYDIEALKLVRKEISVPLVALGGCGKISDMQTAIKAGADAVAAGTIFVFYGKYQAVLFTYPKYSELREVLL